VQARSRDTVVAILEAAARIFSTRGYAAATTNHIAARAGVSIGSLYEYFPNKDALLVALLEAHLADSEAILARTAADTAADGDVRGVVRRFVQAMIDLHARDRALHRVLFEEAPLPPRVRRRFAGIEREVASRVAGWLCAHPGATRPAPPPSSSTPSRA
jgi:AcrR family transcriptional regulator